MFPDDENGDVLRRMHEDGIDLASPRLVDFEHVFADAQSANTFAAELREDVVRVHVCDRSRRGVLGRTVAKLLGEPAQKFEAQCQVRMVPTHEAVTAMEAKLDAVAKRFGGRADGWGTLSNADGSPAHH